METTLDQLLKEITEKEKIKKGKRIKIIIVFFLFALWVSAAAYCNYIIDNIVLEGERSNYIDIYMLVFGLSFFAIFLFSEKCIIKRPVTEFEIRLALREHLEITHKEKLKAVKICETGIEYLNKEIEDQVKKRNLLSEELDKFQLLYAKVKTDYLGIE